VLWTAKETEAVVAAGAKALAGAPDHQLLPEVAAALRKGGRLLRWMGNEHWPSAAWQEWVKLLRAVMMNDAEGSQAGCKEAKLLLSEVPPTWECCTGRLVTGGSMRCV
jgi:hypothetical protein